MIPTLVATRFSSGDPSGPLLLLGPSLGTTAETLWGECASKLTGFNAVGFDLPGHGHSEVATEPFSMAELTSAVSNLAEQLQIKSGRMPQDSFYYAGVSIGGCIGLQLLLDASDRVNGAVLLCTGAKIGEPGMWTDRAALIRRASTSVLLESHAHRWFAEDFIRNSPAAVEKMLGCLSQTDSESYAIACDAIATFDVRGRLAQITKPVLAVAGAHDPVTTVDDLSRIANGVGDGRILVLDSVSHQPPIEAPGLVAELINTHLAPSPVSRVPD